MTRLAKISVCISLLMIVGACGSGSDDVTLGVPNEDSPEPSQPIADPITDPISEPLPANNRVWTVAEVLSEPSGNGSGRDVSCGGEFGFKRCTCAYDVPSSIRYRPALAECNGKAAALLSGNMIDIFSVVVRDSQNRDRWPEAGSGFGGCSFELANSDAPPNSCSAFKVQESFEVADGSIRVHCFGASGYSELFQDAVRLTVKVTDSPFSNDDEIERYCLVSGDSPLN